MNFPQVCLMDVLSSPYADFLRNGKHVRLIDRCIFDFTAKIVEGYCKVNIVTE